VLYWLLASNIAIFSLTLSVKKNSLSILGVIIAFVVMVAIIYYMATIIRMPIGVRPPLTRPPCHTHAHAGTGPKAGIGSSGRILRPPVGISVKRTEVIVEEKGAISGGAVETEKRVCP
jgi:hypothetical protein